MTEMHHVRLAQSCALPPTSSIRILALVSLLCLHALPIRYAVGYEFTGELGLSTEFTDNVNLTEENQSDVGVEVFSSFVFEEDSPRIRGLVDGRLGYRDWLQNNASDEIRPDIHGNLLFHLRPERFSWSLDGAWTQVRENPAEADSPENLSNQLVIWTGPDIRLPVSNTLAIVGSGRVGYSEDSGDSAGFAASSNYSYGATLRIIRDRGGSNQLSANLAARAVRYREDNPDGSSPDYDIVDLGLGYESQMARGDTSLTLGVSFLDQRQSDHSLNLFLSADVGRRLTPLSSGGLRLDFGYNDEAGTAIEPTALPGASRPTGTASSDPFYRARAEAYYETFSRRSRLAGALYVENRDYGEEEGSSDDERHYGVNLTWSRRLSRLTEARINGIADFRDFSQQGNDTQEYTGEVTLSRRLGRNLSADLSVRYRRGTGNNETSTYSETAALLALVYRFSRDRPYSTAHHQQRLTTESGSDLSRSRPDSPGSFSE